MRPAFPSDLMYSPAMGVPDIRQRKFAPRDSFVPAFAAPASGGVPTFTVNRYPRPSTTGSTYAPLPFFVESMNVEASGTSTSANAGFGLFTVRAQSHAMTVSLCPPYAFRSGLSRTISGVTSTFGYRCPIRFSASSRIHWP